MFANKSVPRGENLGKEYRGLNLNREINRFNIDLNAGGVGDPQAWRRDYVGNWIYAPRYINLPDHEVPYQFRYNIERIRMGKDTNLDHWEQNYDGQWEYYPDGNRHVQAQRRNDEILARQRFQESERRRLDEGEDEVRSAESYHSETSQPSDIPGMLTPKMPNLVNLPVNEYNRELIKKIRRSYKKLKREYPSRPMGDRLRGLHWPELEKFRNLVFELNYQRQAISNDQVGRRDFIYPRGRGLGPLASLTPFSVQELGFGSEPRTRERIEDEPGYERGVRLRRQGNPWNGHITREHDRELRSIERATGLNRIPATIKYWILHSKITWRLYTGDYSLTQRFIDTIDRIVRDAVRGGRDFRQEVRDYLEQQGMVGQEIENLLQDLSGVLLELMNLPGNILSIPQQAFNYLKELFTSFLTPRVTEPQPEPEIVSPFVRYRQRGGKTRKKNKSRKKTKRKSRKR